MHRLFSSGYCRLMARNVSAQLDHVAPEQQQQVVVLPFRAETRRLTFGVVLAAAIGVFLLDINLRLGVATAVLYVPVVLLSLFISNARVTAAFAAFATVLTWAAFFVSPHGSVADWVIFMNRTMSVLSIWIAAGLSVTGIRQRLRLNAQKRANDELARSNSELEQFASIASHDLQSPIRKVAGFCERLLDSDPPLDNRQAEFVSRIQTASKRMHTLVTDLLAYSRVSTQEWAPTQVDLNVCVSYVLSDLSEEIEEAGARIEVGDLPTVEADATQMSQLFQNLISNAIKYRNHEAPCTIEVMGAESSRQRGGDRTAPNGEVVFTEIEVKDNGIGIDAEFADQIFDVFVRLHSQEEYEGTGIGLAICKRIAEKHNGQIRVAGPPDGGSTFTIVLPVTQPELQLIPGEAAA